MFLFEWKLSNDKKKKRKIENAFYHCLLNSLISHLKIERGNMWITFIASLQAVDWLTFTTSQLLILSLEVSESHLLYLHINNFCVLVS